MDSIKDVMIGVRANIASIRQATSEINGKIKGMMDNLRKSVKDNMDKVNKDTKKSTDGMVSMFKRMATTMAVAFSFRAIKKFGESCIEVASNLEEVQNVVSVTFRESTSIIDKFAKSARSSFGLSELGAKKYTSTIGAMYKSMGFGNGEITEMSLRMTELAGDMASFYNLSADEAFNKIKSGVSGETEPLKQLGINLSEATLKEYALAQGISKSYKAMGQQEKALLRYNYLLSVTKDVQGDFARNSDSWANRIKVLGLRFESIKASLGTAFIAILNPVVGAISKVVGWLEVASTAFATFITNITGKVQSVTSVTGGIASGIGEAINGVTEGIGDTANEAVGAVKKAKSVLGGFDELITLSKPDSGDSGASGGASGVSGVTPKIETKQIEGKDITPKFNLSIFDNIGKAFDKVKDKVGSLTDILKNGLGWTWDNILKPFGKWTISKAFPVVLEVLSGVLSVLNPVLEIFGDMFSWLWDKYLKDIASWAGKAFVDTMQLVADVLEDIGNWIGENKSLVEGITASVLAFMGAWKGIELLSFIGQAGGVVNALKLITAGLWNVIKVKFIDIDTTIRGSLLYAKDFIVSAYQSIAALVKQGVAFVANTATKIANSIAQVAMNVATAAWNVICAIASAVTTAFGVAVAFLTSPIGLVIIAIIALIGIVVLLVKNWDKVKEVASKVWEGIVGIWKSASSWFSNNVCKPLANVFDVVWNGIKNGFSKAFEFISKAIKGYINGYISLFESMVNGVLWGVNAIIRALNKINVTIPDFVPGIGGKKFGVNIPEVSTLKIPRLAKGGIVSTATQYIAGEAGAEVVFPLQNSKFIEDFAKLVSASMGGSTQGNTFNIGTLIQDDRSYEWLSNIMAQFMARKGYLSN